MNPILFAILGTIVEVTFALIIIGMAEITGRLSEKGRN